MLHPAVLLDASLPAAEVLDRLARHGYWLHPDEPEARAWISEQASYLDRPESTMVERLQRPMEGVWAAIRRQWGLEILWYQRPVEYVIERCQSADSAKPLLDILGLHEPDSLPPIPLVPGGALPERDGVVLRGDEPVAVSVGEREASAGAVAPGEEDRESPRPRDEPALDPDGMDAASEEGSGVASALEGPPETASPAPEAAGEALPPASRGGSFSRRRSRHTRSGGAEESAAPAPERVVETWPRVEGPPYVPAGTTFEVEVGFAAERQAATLGGPVRLRAPVDQAEIELVVELTATGVEAPDGWTRALTVPLDAPESASVTFALVGLEPTGPEPTLTLLEIRYLLPDGEVCGTATRPLVVGHGGVTDPGQPVGLGQVWPDVAPTASPVVLGGAGEPADLTIELLKPDANPARGSYVCRIRSPHPLQAPRGPFPVDLGHDAKTFARQLVDQVRQYGDGPLADNYFRAFGRIAAEQLPDAVHDALREVADRVAPEVPSVLLVSAEPYVPWELTRVDPPLDPARPPYLGAQVRLGRWIRTRPDGHDESTGERSGRSTRLRRPPASPPGALPVRYLAVMAGLYRAESGFRALPEAEAEAKALTATYGAIPLVASPDALRRLLDARLEHEFREVGGADAVHFAGHGEFDPSRPDASVLFLNDGSPLSSILFADARYGDPQQPLIFLNACMVGTGGEILGDSGGFPGNCLRGGFGGVIGALWEVDDAVARDVAREFWARVLPADGSPGEPVAEVLRDIRARYDEPGGEHVPSYLAYAYYGHPELTLTRVVEEA